MHQIRISLPLLAAVVAVTLFAIASPAAQAQGLDDWVKLGEKKVGFGADRDVIQCNPADGRFQTLRVRVLENNVEIVDLKVHFQNGETQDVQVREQIRAGGMTRAINLEGEARFIDKITVIYRTAGRPRPRDRATVQVFGKKVVRATPVPEPVERPLPDLQAPEGWEAIGQRRVGFGADHDVIEAGGGRRFNRLRFRVLENGIHIWDLKVHFANGDVQDVQVRAELAEGGMTRVIDLPGTLRDITRISVWYRTDGRPREGRAVLQAFGKHIETEGWEELGRKHVGFGIDKDVISVTRAEGDFTKIRLRVEESDLHIFKLVVNYGNGDTQDVDLRSDFAENSTSREIDLDGRDRVIRAIHLLYRTEGRPREGRALVIIHGKRGTGPSAMPERDDPPAELSDWKRIGTREVNFAADRDTIIVGPGEQGPYQRIRLRVRGNDLEIGDLEVRFRMGKHDVQVRSNIPQGGMTRIIDLPGNARHITAVQLTYRTAGARREGKAIVEVWAKER